MDVLTKEQRRKNMQNIRSKDTQIEVLLRKALFSKGIRYRKNYEKLPGKPDIVLPRLQKSNNSEFWINKISKNRERDDEVNKKLLFMGWTVIRFWGTDIKKHTEDCVRVIEETIFDIAVEDGTYEE